MAHPVFAHLGHWYVSLPVFMGPALLLIVFLKFQTWRERRERAAPSGKYSNVVGTREGARAVVAVQGPLDYPALVEIEVELGRLAADSLEVLLDLRGLTRADEDSAWQLCDVLARHGVQGCSLSAILGEDPVARPLSAALEAEGIPARREAAQAVSS
jgi:hypothetical protein